MRDQRITRQDPMFAPEWPGGEPSPTRAVRRLGYIEAHSPSLAHMPRSGAAHQATIIANRMMAFDREQTRPMPGWLSLPGEPAKCVWCGHTSTRGDMTWFDSEDDGRGWECENESACHVRLDAIREA